MKISPTGKNLDIFIFCENSFCHNWMAFAGWYSIQQYLPDSNVFIYCLRKASDQQFFFWVNKCSVTFRQFSKLPKLNDKFCLNISAMSVLPYNGNKVVPASSNDSDSTFVDYREGCGNFVLNEWKEKSTTPFFNAVDRFASSSITVNEVRILRLWEQMDSTYKAMN